MNLYPDWASNPRDQTKYMLQIAAVRHQEDGNLYTLSEAIGRHRGYFHAILKDGRSVPAEAAVALEKLTGCPREAFAPDVFKGLTRAE